MYPSYTNTPIGSAQPAQNYPASAPVAMPQKSSKGKKLAILGVIVVAIIAVIAVMIILLQPKDSEAVAFNKLANYIITGNADEVAPSEEVEVYDYKIITVSDGSDDEIADYYDGLETYVANMLKCTSNDELKNFAYGVGIYGRYRVITISSAVKSGKYSDEEYIEKIKSSLKKYINSKNSEISNYGKKLQEYFEIEVAYYKKVAEKGCDLQNISYSCYTIMEEADAEVSYNETTASIYDEITSGISNLYGTKIDNIFSYMEGLK